MAYYNQPFAVKLFISLMTCVSKIVYMIYFDLHVNRIIVLCLLLGNRSSAELTVVSVLWILDN